MDGIFGNSPNFDQSFGFEEITFVFSDSNQLISGFLPTTVSKSEIEMSKLFSASILFDVAPANLAFA